MASVRAFFVASSRVATPIAPYSAAVERLQTIPGVDRRAAEVLVAEVGTDMTRFATADHLCSWAGMSPGNDRSAGKRRSGRTTKGDRWLRSVVVQAAWAASHTKTTILGATERRFAVPTTVPASNFPRPEAAPRQRVPRS